MLLPLNGRIVILDDKIEQALPLIMALSKSKIPFTFHTEDNSQLPQTPYDDIRLLFLDINLTEGVNEDAIKAQLQATLSRILSPNSVYMLAVWSIRENEYNDLLNDLFINSIPLLKPLLKISLAKNSLFKMNDETGNYESDPDINLVREINNRLIEQIKNSDTFKALLVWENMVQKSITLTIKQLSNLITRNEFWNANLKHLLYKMAHAQLGKTLKKESEAKILLAAFRTLNTSLNDKLESSLYDEQLPTDIDIKRQGVNYVQNVAGRVVRLKWDDLNTNIVYIDGTEKSQNKVVEKLKGSNAADTAIIEEFKNSYKVTSPRLNAELLISLKQLSLLHPGNVYYKSVTGAKKRKLLNTYFKGIHKKSTDGSFVVNNLSTFLFVELECTPICDYSQNKRLRSRILPGILYPNVHHSLLSQDADSLYKEIPAFEFKGLTYRLVFDYRLFKSFNLEHDKRNESEFLFRLKPEVLVDIQSRISSHVSRLGIITIV